MADGFLLVFFSEPVLVNVYGAQESIPPGWESIPGFLKKFTNTGSDKNFHLMKMPMK